MTRTYQPVAVCGESRKHGSEREDWEAIPSSTPTEEARIAYSEAEERLRAADAGEDRQEKIQATQALKRARARYQAAGGMVQI
ncbi:MAG: hypothetical protein GDA56_23390 [Hormoscilla sp. GM7CHS1pb]|nr:hypothetical protein [Hormoscilla sp. GM7CHS1pb]